MNDFQPFLKAFTTPPQSPSGLFFPQFSPANSPSKNNNSPNKLATAYQSIPFINSNENLRNPDSNKVITHQPSSSGTSKTSNFFQQAFSNPTIYVTDEIQQVPEAPLNPPQQSPGKSPLKRAHSAINNENIAPESPQKKPHLPKVDDLIRELMLLASGETLNTKGWIRAYERVTHINFSTAKILDAINADPNPVQREKCLLSLIKIKLSVCSLAWSILPSLEILNTVNVEKGYFSTITLTLFDGALNQFLKEDDSVNEDLAFLLKESFSKAVSNRSPNPKAIINDWKNHKPVFLRAGWDGHVVGLLIYKNYVAYGNKGEQHPNFKFSGIKYFMMSLPDNFNEEFIRKIFNRVSAPEFVREQKNFLENQEMERELGLIPIFQEPMKPQRGAYCSHAVCTINLRSLLSLHNFSEADKIASFLIPFHSTQSLTLYKKIKKFNRVYNLSEVIDLLSKPEIFKLISQKDMFSFTSNLRNKIDFQKFSSYTAQQQASIVLFFNNFLHQNPLRIEACITEFPLSYKESTKIVKKLLHMKETGNYIIRKTKDPEVLIVNYIDQKGKVKFIKIRKEIDGYKHGNLKISTIQELPSTQKHPLMIPFRDSIAQKALCNN